MRYRNAYLDVRGNEPIKYSWSKDHETIQQATVAAMVALNDNDGLIVEVRIVDMLRARSQMR